MTHNPIISVLMPVFNGEKYLKKSIDSIVNQTFKNFELIIINDGSSDNTLNIVNSYSDNRIRIINNKKNIGIVRSLNKGISTTRGKYIARLDSDDLSNLDRLQKQLFFLENNFDFGLVGSWVEVINENGKSLDLWKINLSSEEIYYNLIFYNCIIHSSVMFRKEILKKIGLYREECALVEDYDLWNRISKNYKIFIISEFLVKFRVFPESLSMKNKDLQDKNTKLVSINNSKINSDLYDYILNKRRFSLIKKIFLLKKTVILYKTIFIEAKEIKLNQKKMLNLLFINFLKVIRNIFFRK